MDETDKKILNLLKENARMSYSEIAQKVALSAPAVKERITKLEENGIIDKYTIQLNHQKMGKNITAWIMFETSNCKAFREFCAHQTGVLEYYRIAGKYSYLVKAVMENMAQLEIFIDESLRFGTPSTHIIFSSTTNDFIE